MGQSVKILAPKKRVFMPRIACCSMARMIDDSYFDESIAKLKEYGITEVFPVTYINSNAEVKAKVAELGGVVCTSSNAAKILDFALKQNKKIFSAFLFMQGMPYVSLMGLMQEFQIR